MPGTSEQTQDIANFSPHDDHFGCGTIRVVIYESHQYLSFLVVRPGQDHPCRGFSYGISAPQLQVAQVSSFWVLQSVACCATLILIKHTPPARRRQAQICREREDREMKPLAEQYPDAWAAIE
ncbi:MAG: hypothetical protein RLN85_05995, partial [Pseudomonadales bacterium]